jgi:S-disulfanyl-L-cysteine oxidoreductase SoxD
MRSFRSNDVRAAGLALVIAIAAGFGCVTLLGQTQSENQSKPQAPGITGVGTTPTQEDMGNLAWTAGPSGKDLPAGSGTAKQGANIFLAKCSMCHGANLQGIHWQPGQFSPVMGLPLARPDGGGLVGSGAGSTPNKEARSPWTPPITGGAPFPEVIFNTIAVEMPMLRPGTLKADEVYSLAAFIFFKNGLVKEDDVLNRDTLPKIQMPNRTFFPSSDAVYMNMNKRGCYQTHGVCLGD